MWLPRSPAVVPNETCPNQNKHPAQQAAHTRKKKRLEISVRVSPILNPLWHLLPRAWGPTVACRAARSQTAVPGHDFKLRNAELRTQSNPCEGTDVLDKSHSSLSSNTRYHPALGDLPVLALPSSSRAFLIYDVTLPFPSSSQLLFHCITLSLFGSRFSSACPRYANTNSLIFRSD